MSTLAYEFGVHRNAISRHLVSRGVRTSKSMTAAESSRAVMLYASGLSSIEVGKQLGFDNHTVLKAVAAAGLPVRKVLGR